MKTVLCNILGIDIPIIQAPMGGAVGPKLTAAVSNAGALGTIPLWVEDIATLRRLIRETQSLTDRPFAVNLNVAFADIERLEACLEERVPVISFFWGNASKLAPIAKSKGVTVMQTVGTAKQAKDAVSSGADIVVAQGWEAGGHVWGTVASMALVPSVVDAVSPVPVVAAGGIADGRGLAAALALGASGAWIGTRFLASPEAIIHQRYRDRLFEASENDTVYLENLFDIGWPDAPHRVLRNWTVKAWEAAGSPEAGMRPGEGDVVASSNLLGTIVRYRPLTPGEDIEGNIDDLSLWAGQGVGLVNEMQSAAQIVREIHDGALTVLERMGRLSA